MNGAWVIGAPIRVKDDTVSAFAGRDGWVRYPDEENRGYYIRVGVADHLWFALDELEDRRVWQTSGDPGRLRPLTSGDPGAVS